MTKTRILSLLAAGTAMTLVLTACQEPRHLSPDFGNAVHQNMAAHVIDPTPMPLDEEGPAFQGRRAAEGIDRYNTGRVIQPRPLATTRIGGGGGN